MIACIRSDKLGFAGEIMIVLITGASYTGKTVLAQKLLEKYKYPYLSIDHLKMGLICSGNHFADIKRYANVIESRLDDGCCTLESVLEDNAQFLEMAQKHNANYVFIDDKYEISIDI